MYIIQDFWQKKSLDSTESWEKSMLEQIREAHHVGISSETHRYSLLNIVKV
uniref:Uncharacterized protein n=1 Tax=Arundo donax TaxID=35708 RepID=A0A0A8YA00_ARUDO